jgi:hypothetical protein
VVSTGFGWIPVTGCPPCGTSHAFEFTRISGDPGWTLTGVASQKNGPDAGDVARFAPQHTKCSGRNRKNNGLAGCGESFFGQPVAVRTKKTVDFWLRRRFSAGQAVGNCPSQTTPSNLPQPASRAAGFPAGPWPGPRKPGGHRLRLEVQPQQVSCQIACTKASLNLGTFGDTDNDR